MQPRPYSRVPSLKALHEAFGPKAAILRDILTGAKRPEEACEKTAEWIRACFHRPSDAELIEHACGALLGYGTEAIFGRDDSCHMHRPALVYVNMGDPYATTLLFHGASVTIGCWGDWLESYERRHGRIE